MPELRQPKMHVDIDLDVHTQLKIYTSKLLLTSMSEAIRLLLVESNNWDPKVVIPEPRAN